MRIMTEYTDNKQSENDLLTWKQKYKLLIT